MSKNNKQVSALSLEGRFLSFILEDGHKIKHLRLATSQGELCIKLSKEARASVKGVLSPGSWISVVGERSVNLTTGELKYKALAINPALTGQGGDALVSPAKKMAKNPKVHPATILVCQKSDCMKRGGKAVCQALQATLSDRGLQNQVIIKGTGCMKQCKAGPHLVMPDKTRYSRITAKEIPQMIDQHFPVGIPGETLTEIAPEYPELSLLPIA